MLEIFKEYGLPLGILIVLAYWYAKKDKQHREEREILERTRKEERETLEKLHRDERESVERSHKEERDTLRKTVEGIADNSNKAFNNSTQALTELSTLVKSMKK